MWNCHHYGITKTESERCYLGKVDLSNNNHCPLEGWSFDKSDWWRDHTVKDRKKMKCNPSDYTLRTSDEFNIYPEELSRISIVKNWTTSEIKENWPKIKNESWWKLDRECILPDMRGKTIYGISTPELNPRKTRIELEYWK